MQSTGSTLLAAEGIKKAFGAFYALKGVSFHLEAGEIHALFGANGAGKSTLAKVLCGHHKPTEGRLTAFGQEATYSKPREAMDAGIGIVTQETSLADDLTVWENIALPFYGSKKKPSQRELYSMAESAIARLGFADEISVDRTCAELSAAHRQLVEIARIVALDSRVIILDEPTAALSPGESARLFKVMNALRDEGRGLIFVSHRLEEIFLMTDRITILRDGSSVESNIPTASLTQAELIHLMVGREVEALTSEVVSDTSGAEVAFALHEVRSAPEVRSVSLEIKQGEIVGLGGLVGAGRSELAETIMGLRPLQSGQIEVFGKRFTPQGPKAASQVGIGFLPEDRRRQSIIPDFSVRENILLSHLSQGSGQSLKYGTQADRIDELAELIELATDRLDDTSLLNFSGGMQQKALLIRALLLKPKILILDEPTKGVDIGSRATIYSLLRRLAADGMAILVISSDFEELLALSHRIVPISDGRSIGEVPASDINEEQLTLIAAPRSSLDHQNDILSSLAETLGVQAGWMLNAGDRVLCLTRQGSAEGIELPQPGTLTLKGETTIANGLTSDRGEVCEEQGGHQSLLMIVENNRGIGLGSIAVVAPPGETLDPVIVKSETINTLAKYDDGQLHLRASRKSNEPGEEKR